MPSNPPADTVAAWAQVKSDGEAILYRLASDGYVLRLGEDGSLKIGRYDKKRLPLPDGLKHSLRSRRSELEALLEPLSTERVADIWQRVMDSITEIYPPGRTVDLTEATLYFQMAQRAAEAENICAWRYYLHRGCASALRQIEQEQDRQPVYEQPSLS